MDLIATDPPFNKGKDFHATPDSLAKGASFQDRWSWDRDVHQDWVDQLLLEHENVYQVIKGSRKAYGDDMGAFLCFMAVRLLAMRRVLKDTGSIYLHCDPTASHYLKELMDSIFGKKNFRNEIVWCYTSPSNTKRWFPRKHDIILFYSKSDKWTFNDGDVRIPYKEESFTMGGKGSLAAANRKGNYKTGIKEQLAKGKLVEDWWYDIRPLSVSKEHLGYPTQKPVALYERIIKASSKKDDVVLDPFCGCATTLIAAENLGRKWIGIDIWEKAHKVVLQRIKKECKLGMLDEIREDLLSEKGKIRYIKSVPKRTDEGNISTEILPTIERKKNEMGLTREKMFEVLEKRDGLMCRGCDRVFDNRRYFELDHRFAKSEGGDDKVSNRILLCSPCNKAKSNTYTLTGLRRQNKKDRFMADQTVK